MADSPAGSGDPQAIDTERPELLTEEEHAAMALTGQLARLMHVIIGRDGPTSDTDWNEAALRIHSVQHMILAQAAARAYPEQYRLLGRSFRITEAPRG